MNTYRNNEHALRRLAYSLWIERGKPHGSPEIDWERAERLMEMSGDDDDSADVAADYEVERFTPVAAEARAETDTIDPRDDGIMDGAAEGMMVPSITELARESAEHDAADRKNRGRGARP